MTTYVFDATMLDGGQANHTLYIPTSVGIYNVYIPTSVGIYNVWANE